MNNSKHKTYPAKQILVMRKEEAYAIKAINTCNIIYFPSLNGIYTLFFFNRITQLLKWARIMEIHAPYRPRKGISKKLAIRLVTPPAIDVVKMNFELR